MCVYIYIYIYIYICMTSWPRAPRPQRGPSHVHLEPKWLSVLWLIRRVRICKLRIADSKLLGNSLWNWEFHPSNSRFCLSQIL